MSKKLLLDTHVLVWAIQDTGMLSQPIRKLLTDESVSELLLSSISLWEISKLVQKKRLELGIDLHQWFDRALTHPKMRVVEITSKIAIESTCLPGKFHEDPADQIIAATARVEKSILVTKDQKMRSYSFIETLW